MVGEASGFTSGKFRRLPSGLRRAGAKTNLLKIFSVYRLTSLPFSCPARGQGRGKFIARRIEGSFSETRQPTRSVGAPSRPEKQGSAFRRPVAQSIVLEPMKESRSNRNDWKQRKSLMLIKLELTHFILFISFHLSRLSEEASSPPTTSQCVPAQDPRPFPVTFKLTRVVTISCIFISFLNLEEPLHRLCGKIKTCLRFRCSFVLAF